MIRSFTCKLMRNFTTYVTRANVFCAVVIFSLAIAGGIPALSQYAIVRSLSGYAQQMSSHGSTAVSVLMLLCIAISSMSGELPAHSEADQKTETEGEKS